MAQMTITVPDAQVPRILAAFNAAGVADVKVAIIGFLKDTVRSHETTTELNALKATYQAAVAAYVSSADIDPT